MTQSEKKLRMNYVILFLMGFIAGRFSIQLDIYSLSIAETHPALTLQSEYQKEEFVNSTGHGLFLVALLLLYSNNFLFLRIYFN